MEAEVVVICVQKPRRHVVTLALMVSISPGRKRRDRAIRPHIAAAPFFFDLAHFDFWQSANAEDLAGAHVLQKVAHHQIGRCLHVGCGNAVHKLADLSISMRAFGWMAKPMT